MGVQVFYGIFSVYAEHSTVLLVWESYGIFYAFIGHYPGGDGGAKGLH